MTHNQRIALNTVATYGRSLLSLGVGLFSSRWVLMSLGAEDLGLYGLVAGLVTFISFFNGLFSGSITRFYAYSVGEVNRPSCSREGLENCRKWFNTAVLVHSVLPLVFVAIGYPICEYAVRHWLVIPENRIADCVWVLRFVCLTTLVSMMTVPVSAMYTAKQKIAELTVYSVCGTLLNFAFVAYMVTHPGRAWLKSYAGFSCLLSALPNLIITIRAFMIFPECHFYRAYWFDWKRIRELCQYSFWSMLGGLGYMIDIQGQSVLVNKGFGPAFNATSGIAGAVGGHCATLSSALSTAFQPAIINLEGAGQRQKMLDLSYGGAKVSMLLCMIFVLPLMAELDTVLTLWLKTPPPQITQACFWVLISVLVRQMAFGLETTLAAINKVGYINVASLTSHILAVIVGWVGVFVYKQGFVFVIQVELIRLFCYNVIGFFISTRYTGYSYRIWMSDMILKPLILVGVCELSGTIIKEFLFEFYYIRMFFVFVGVEFVFLILAWFFALTQTERNYIAVRIRNLKIVRNRF